MSTVATGRFTSMDAFVGGELVSVFDTGTTTLASLYTDKITGTLASNPVTTDEFGTLQFFAVPGDYDLVFPAGDLSRTITITVQPDPTNAWPGGS
jgi:hypothetical protein